LNKRQIALRRGSRRRGALAFQQFVFILHNEHVISRELYISLKQALDTVLENIETTWQRQKERLDEF